MTGSEPLQLHQGWERERQTTHYGCHYCSVTTLFRGLKDFPTPCYSYLSPGDMVLQQLSITIVAKSFPLDNSNSSETWFGKVKILGFVYVSSSRPLCKKEDSGKLLSLLLWISFSSLFIFTSMPARPYKVADQEEQRQKSRAVIGQFVFINHFQIVLKELLQKPNF